MGRPVIREREIEKRLRLQIVRVFIDAVNDNEHLSVGQIAEALGLGFGPENEKTIDTLRRVENNAEFCGLVNPRRESDK